MEIASLLTLLSILLAIIAYLLDNYKSRKQERRHLTLTYLEKIIYEEGPILQANDQMVIWKAENREFPDDKIKDPQEQMIVTRILNFYDLIADSAMQGIIEKRMIVTHLGGRMKDAHTLLHAYILHRRKSLGRPGLYRPFEKFVEEIKNATV